MSLIDNKEQSDQHPDKPSRKKPMFPVSDPLRSYLKHHGREVKLPVTYKDLLHYICRSY